MSVVETESNVRPSKVAVEPSILGGSNVWLRRDIREEVRDDEPVWVANEVSFRSKEVVSANEIELEFEALWEKYSVPQGAGMSLDDQVQVLFAAVGELGVMVAGVEV